MQEKQVWLLGQEDPLEKEMATHSYIFALEMPWTEKPGRESMESQKKMVTQSCLTLRPHGLYNPWNSPGQNTGVGSLSLLQGIFPTQGSNPGLPYCGQILYQLSHQGSPRILEWVAFPFSRRSSWPRNQTRVSCIAGRFFTNWAMREAQRLGHKLATKTTLVIMSLPSKMLNSSKEIQ